MSASRDRVERFIGQWWRENDSSVIGAKSRFRHALLRLVEEFVQEEIGECAAIARGVKRESEEAGSPTRAYISGRIADLIVRKRGGGGDG